MKIVAQLEHDQLPSLPLAEVAGIANRPATAGGNRPRSAIACGRCDRWWTGRNEAHCSACHETFTCIGAFDWHRRNGQCRKPPDVGLVVADRSVVRLESARHLERP